MGSGVEFQIIDIFSCIVLARIAYIAATRGIFNEILKFVGIIIASFFALQYYALFLGGLLDRTPFSFDRGCVYAVSFGIIFAFTYGVFFFFRKAIAVLFKQETYPHWQIFFAVCMGLTRTALLVSIVLFFFGLCGVSRPAWEKSFSSRWCKKIAPIVYTGIFKVYGRINPLATLNKDVAGYLKDGPNIQSGMEV